MMHLSQLICHIKGQVKNKDLKVLKEYFKKELATFVSILILNQPHHNCKQGFPESWNYSKKNNKIKLFQKNELSLAVRLHWLITTVTMEKMLTVNNNIIIIVLTVKLSKTHLWYLKLNFLLQINYMFATIILLLPCWRFHIGSNCKWSSFCCGCSWNSMILQKLWHFLSTWTNLCTFKCIPQINKFFRWNYEIVQTLWCAKKNLTPVFHPVRSKTKNM